MVPSFTKPGSLLKQKMINARSESLKENRVFRRLLSSKTCVVVTNGFYEWQRQSKTKTQPYYIHRGEDAVVKLAALYDHWTGRRFFPSLLTIDSIADGEVILYTVSIVTTEASEHLKWCHDRMPVILPDDASMNAWLEGEGPNNSLQQLCRPYSEKDLLFHPVTPQMGNVNFQGEECCLDIRRHGLGNYMETKADTSRKRESSPERAASETKRSVKKIKTEIEDESGFERKRLKRDFRVMTEEPEMETKKVKKVKTKKKEPKLKTKKVKEEEMEEDAPKPVVRKRMQPPSQERSPVRKSARLMAKDEMEKSKEKSMSP